MNRAILSQPNPNLNHNLNPNTIKKLGETPTPPHPPQTQTTQKNKNRVILRKQKLLVYINKAQKSFQVRPQPKDSPIGPEKDQNDFKKAKNQRARKQKILKNESYHSI